jgi:hypothetical protein
MSDYDKFFDELDSQKQGTFEHRVCRAIIKGLGLASTTAVYFRGQAGDPECFTPEWFSDYTSCPITFRAVRDFRVEQAFNPKKMAGFPDPNWMLAHRIDGPKTRKLWAQLWEETRERFGATSRHLAVCFRPAWAEHIVALHNYTEVISHFPSKDHPVRGGMLVWQTGQGNVILQYLRDLMSVLRSHWQWTFDP